MIEGLDDTRKEVVTLKVLGGYTHREIGIMMDKPTSTIKWLYATAIKQLRTALAGFISSFVLLLGGLIASIVLHVKDMNTKFIEIPGNGWFNSQDGPPITILVSNPHKPELYYIVLGIMLAIGIFAWILRKNKKKLKNFVKTPTI